IDGPRSRQIRQLVAPWSAGAAIRQRLEGKQYDVVDVASAEGLRVAASRGRTFAVVSRSNGLEHLNYRRMLEDHDAGLVRKGWTRRIWYPLTRLSQVAMAARSADRLLLLNEDDRRYAIEHGWKREDEIDLVPHGVSERFLGDAPAGERGQGLL